MHKKCNVTKYNIFSDSCLIEVQKMEKRLKALISSIVPCSTIDNFQDTSASTFMGFPKEPKDPKDLSTFFEEMTSPLGLVVMVLSVTNFLFLVAILILIVVVCKKPEVGQHEEIELEPQPIEDSDWTDDLRVPTPPKPIAKVKPDTWSMP